MKLPHTKIKAHQGLPGGSDGKEPTPAMWETQVRSLGQEDALEKEMATRLQYSWLENPIDGEASGLQSMGLQRVGHH